MVSSRLKIISLLVIILLATSILLFAFKFYYDHGIQYPKSLTDFNDTGDYQINPKTILSDINNGKINVFSPTPLEATPLQSSPLPWKQSDYFLVANALHQFVWNDTLDNWNIYGMSFFKDCQEDLTGLGSGYITLFKDSNQQAGTYAVHEVGIYPDGSGVSWGGAESWRRPLFGWKSINLNKLKITADDALQIAEENGGKEFREKTNNVCNISLILKPNTEYDYWAIYYNSDNSISSFDFAIDPYTSWD